VNESVTRAIDELRAAYPGAQISVSADGNGGAAVIVDPVPIGSLYKQDTTWIGFRITFQYPYADVYPHFIGADAERRDGRALGDGISTGHNFLGRPALQLSRRSNRLNPAIDTAAHKLAKVLQWLSTHP
jgi:hypothetical protein